jgi:hypothetical protein
MQPVQVLELLFGVLIAFALAVILLTLASRRQQHGRR